MDRRLRELEQLAARGDPGARAALARAYARAGRGWAGEALPAGLQVGPAPPVYRWAAPAGLFLELVYVPPGSFFMGTDDRTEAPNTRPRHAHPLPYGYWIGRTPVVWRDYAVFCAAEGWALPRAPAWGQPPEHPVVNVSWEEAAAFCAWAGLELPGEAEWEKAARGNDGRRYPWGGAAPEPGRCAAEEDPRTGDRSTAAVHAHPEDVSPYGLLGAAGNVHDWCRDPYERDAYRRYARGDLAPPASGEMRVIRGGRWRDPGALACVWKRWGRRLRPGSYDIGFRPLLRLPQSSP